jgi:WD40 repeat protein
MVGFSVDGVIQLYSINLSESIFLPSQVYKGHLAKVNVLAFDPTSQRIASGSNDHTVRIWGVSEGLLQIYRGHKSPIFDVQFTDMDDYVVSSGEDCLIIFWNYISLEETIVVQS